MQMDKQPQIIGIDQNTDYLERPRLFKLLENAIKYPVVILCAGAGYGKTHAVSSFLSRGEPCSTAAELSDNAEVPRYETRSFSEDSPLNTAWLRVSERDNLTTRFWENLTSAESMPWPKIRLRLQKIGFPRTNEALVKFNAIRREVDTMPGKYIRVIDDFHLLNNPEVLKFFEYAVNTSSSSMTIILISRSMPDLNLMGMMMRERVFTIQEDALRFSEDEIAAFFNQKQLMITKQDVLDIYNDTEGWAFAVNLIARSLARKQRYERYALTAMKKNIFRLIEAEISHTVSRRLWRFLLRISLIDHLAASLIKTLSRDGSANGGNKNGETLIKEMESLNAYIRYDYNQDTYLIHHLLRDYLRQNQDQTLTDKEKKETYQIAGDWCNANGYLMDALSYYEKSGDYMKVALIFLPNNLQIPRDMALYALGVFDHAPKEEMFSNTIVPSMYLKLLISLDRLDEAVALAPEFIAVCEALPESVERNRNIAGIYGHLGVAVRNSCTYTDVYDFDYYFKKMGEYYDRTPFEAYGKYPSMLPIAWASLVGTSRAGALEEYIGAISRCLPDVSRVMNGLLIGYDDLLWGELCFYRGEFIDAEKHLKLSVDKAITHDQYLTQNLALAYLMEMALIHGDLATATAKLAEIEALTNIKDYDIRYETHDIARGFYNLALRLPEQVPEWLKENFSFYAHPSFLENYANRIKAQYYYQTRQYSALLAFIESEMEKRSILFDKIELLILRSLSFYHIKRKREAIEALTEVYNLAEPNKIVIPFIQQAKDMRTLTASVIKDNNRLASGTKSIQGARSIPGEWLENIHRKASTCYKRKAKMISDYKAAKNPSNEIALTDRQIAILKDLCDGLSRTEIATSRNISINTVKMAITSIYNKLGVFGLPEAIRVAVDRKII